jgi:hypothetical protein
MLNNFKKLFRNKNLKICFYVLSSVLIVKETGKLIKSIKMNFYNFSNRFKKQKEDVDKELCSAYDTYTNIPSYNSTNLETDVDIERDINIHLKLSEILHKLNYVHHSFYRTERVPTDKLFELDLMFIMLYSYLKPELSILHIIIKDYETLKEEFVEKKFLNERKYKFLVNEIKEYIDIVEKIIYPFTST